MVLKWPFVLVYYNTTAAAAAAALLSIVRVQLQQQQQQQQTASRMQPWHAIAGIPGFMPQSQVMHGM